MKKMLTSNQINQKLGAIVFYTTKTKVIAYSEKTQEDGSKIKLPVTKSYKSVMKRMPLLAVHVADTDDHDPKLKNTSKDKRRGDSVNSIISEKEYLNWIKSHLVDVYNIKDVKEIESYMANVDFPTFNEIKEKFYEAVA
jgi:hypothetical protein